MASGSIFLGVATLFIVLLGVGAVLSLGLLTTDPANRNNTITVSGTGEAYAVPDIATFSFTAREEAETVKEAQDTVSEQVSSILAALEEVGIEEKDIKTTSYNSYPRYEWRETKSLCTEFSCPPSDSERVLVGYEQSQSVAITVRDLDKVSQVLEVLGGAEVASMYGPSFEVDDQDAALTEARKEAIAKATEKAEMLTEELGVRLGKVVSFSDGSSGGYEPIMYARGGVAMDMAVAEEASIAPQIPSGENRITASVSVTFKIK